MSNQENREAPFKQSTQATKESRRRFVRGVGLATPVILAVSSRSALATGGLCLSPSATASIALQNSRPDREKTACSGGSHGFWKNASRSDHHNHTFWIKSGAGGKLFSDVFGDSGAFPGKTLKDVVRQNAGADPSNLGANLVAAWCNLNVGFVPATVLSLQQMKDMWRYRNSGYMPVPGGDAWNAAMIVDYLETTHTRE
jgi:hypothetical protein